MLNRKKEAAYSSGLPPIQASEKMTEEAHYHLLADIATPFLLHGYILLAGIISRA